MSTGFFNHLIAESKSYNQLSKIDALVEGSSDLSNIPVQPLYTCLKQASSDQLAEYLPKCSAEQRKFFLDIDTWERDQIDPESYSSWIEAYSKCRDEDVVFEFVSGESFALYLKFRLNAYTFDVEDPIYPDHDNYFLTEDNLLLIEYNEDFKYVHEVKQFIKDLYTRLGVEKAYQYLFKVFVDSHSWMEEEEYRQKKLRLADIGLVSFEESLEILHPYANEGHLKKMIESREEIQTNIDAFHTNQIPHSAGVNPYNEGMESIATELSKLKDQKRSDFLRFSFVRLVNASLVFTGAIKESGLRSTEVGKNTKNLLLLGFDYLKKNSVQTSEEGVFKNFDFYDLYKIGKTIVDSEQKILKRALNSFELESDDTANFFGDFWENFLEDSFKVTPVLLNLETNKKELVNTLSTFNAWQARSLSFTRFLPYISKFYQTFIALKNDDLIQDQFYLNYNLNEINLEAILISVLANHYLGKGSEEAKLGLSLEEYKKFIDQIITNPTNAEVKAQDNELITDMISHFMEDYGLTAVLGLNDYLYTILKTQVEGYNFSDLTDEDFKHVGGAIIFAS